jgi:hypothetical protein
MSSGLRAAIVVLAAALAACGSPAPSSTTSHPVPSAAAPAAAAAPPAAPPAVASGNLIDHPASISDADIPPLPAVAFEPARPMAVVRAVFVFAAKHPEVLSHVPCFCGCQHMGHQNNDDCFVKARDGRERPIAWEVHGMG